MELQAYLSQVGAHLVSIEWVEWTGFSVWFWSVVCDNWNFSTSSWHKQPTGGPKTLRIIASCWTNRAKRVSKPLGLRQRLYTNVYIYIHTYTYSMMLVCVFSFFLLAFYDFRKSKKGWQEFNACMFKRTWYITIHIHIKYHHFWWLIMSNNV